MRIETPRIFRLPKRGNTMAECEDHCAVDANLGRFALADGATASSFADLWAHQLVNRFIFDPAVIEPGQWESWLPPLQANWCSDVDNRRLPWYAEEKAAEGAFAAFLAVMLDDQQRWRAVAVGDCCVCQVRGDALLHKFPIMAAKDFSFHPWLIGSRSPPDEIGALKKDLRLEADWQPGDRFLLMSDALAKWFLEQCEAGGHPAQLADHLLTPDDDAFAARIDRLRDDKTLHNDDVTLVHFACS